MPITPESRLLNDSYERQKQRLFERAKESDGKVNLILDMDETLLDTVAYWVEQLNKYLVANGLCNTEQVPTIAEVQAKGGTDNVYRNIFPADQYDLLMGYLRGTRLPNRLPQLIGTAASVLGNLDSEEFPVLGYLTARPNQQAAYRATGQQVAANYLPEAPVVAKPLGVPLSQTSPWKTGLLVESANLIDGRSKILMVDDSLGLAKYFATQADDLPNNLCLGIFPGPLTNPETAALLAEGSPAIHFLEHGWDSLNSLLIGLSNSGQNA